LFTCFHLLQYYRFWISAANTLTFEPHIFVSFLIYFTFLQISDFCRRHPYFEPHIFEPQPRYAQVK
jgi:hypothetical protein